MGWSHVILEGHCGFNWIKDKTKKPPKWCSNKNKKICAKCLIDNCPLFGYTEADLEDIELFNWAWEFRHKILEKEEEKRIEYLNEDETNGEV